MADQTKTVELKNTISKMGTGFIGQIKNFVSTNKFNIGIAVGVLVLLAAVGYFFRSYFNKKFAQKTGFEDDVNEKKECQFIFFYTTWCPYCKKFLPIWNEFSTKWNGKTLNGYLISMSEVDCDQDEATANKFDVVGYPTIKCVMNGKTTDFDAKPSRDSLNQFLTTCVGNA
jgi:thiol-disulfide isomerase/thioredoxin